MQKRTESRIGVLLLVGAAACTSESSRAPEGRGPAPEGQRANTAAPQVVDHQGSTLQGEPAAAERRARERTASDSYDATAKASLEPLPGSKLAGTAALREAGKDVRIALEVKQATPGASRVAVRDSGHCEAAGAQKKLSASTTVPTETGLGTLLVDSRGEGKLDVTLKEANLKTEGHGSLLGKSLVVYRMQPPAQRGERAERTVACAKIVPN